MKILLVSIHHDVHEQKIGAQYRIRNLIEQMERHGHKVTILQPYRFKKTKTRQKTYYFREHTLPFLKDIKWEYFPLLTDINLSFIWSLYRVIKREKVDIIQIEYPWGVITAKIISKLFQWKIKVIYDAHDIEYRLIHQFVYSVLVKRQKLLKYLFVPGLLYIYAQEKIAALLVDQILTVSENDRLFFTQYYTIPNWKVTTILSGINPSDINVNENRSTIRTKLGILPEQIVAFFHGSYKHFPNKEAFDLIENYLSPNIPEVFFLVAGTNVPVYEKGNYQSLGFVKDLNDLLNSVDMAIIPIRSGGGTRIKILDYMRMGLPMVSTKKGIEGISMENNKHAIIVRDVDESFTKAIRSLALDMNKCRNLGENARELASTKFNWNQIGNKLNNLYRKCYGA